jgi:hypothetical protein
MLFLGLEPEVRPDRVPPIRCRIITNLATELFVQKPNRD